jgi:hypothetical protein
MSDLSEERDAGARQTLILQAFKIYQFSKTSVKQIKTLNGMGRQQVI